MGKVMKVGGKRWNLKTEDEKDSYVVLAREMNGMDGNGGSSIDFDSTSGSVGGSSLLSREMRRWCLLIGWVALRSWSGERRNIL